MKLIKSALAIVAYTVTVTLPELEKELIFLINNLTSSKYA